MEATSGDSNRSMGRGDSSIEDYVLVKSESFTQCFSRGRYLHFIALAGAVHFRDVKRDMKENADQNKGSSKNLTKERIKRANTSEEPNEHMYSPNAELLQGTCLIKLSVPASKVLKLTLKFCSGLKLQVFENETEHNLDSENNNIYNSRNANQIYEFHRENQIQESRQTNQQLLALGCDSWSPSTHVFTRSDTVWLALSVERNDTSTPAFHLHFAAMSESQAAQLQLQLVYTSPSTGNWHPL